MELCFWDRKLVEEFSTTDVNIVYVRCETKHFVQSTNWLSIIFLSCYYRKSCLNLYSHFSVQPFMIWNIISLTSLTIGGVHFLYITNTYTVALLLSLLRYSCRFYIISWSLFRTFEPTPKSFSKNSIYFLFTKNNFQYTSLSRPTGEQKHSGSDDIDRTLCPRRF